MNVVSRDEAAKLLNDGKVGVLPTDTVYGLVARAADESAVTRMYALKKREQKPGTLIAADTTQLSMLGVSDEQISRVSQYWPNPLSAVLAVHGNDYLHQGVGSLAMRVVADEDTRQLLEKTGPLMTSSANQPGEPGATNLEEAYEYFGETIDFYVDGGVIADVLPSTIIRPNPDGIEILRPGSVDIN